MKTEAVVSYLDDFGEMILLTLFVHSLLAKFILPPCENCASFCQQSLFAIVLVNVALHTHLLYGATFSELF